MNYTFYFIPYKNEWIPWRGIWIIPRTPSICATESPLFTFSVLCPTGILVHQQFWLLTLIAEPSGDWFPFKLGRLILVMVFITTECYSSYFWLKKTFDYSCYKQNFKTWHYAFLSSYLYLMAKEDRIAHYFLKRESS